MFHNARHPCCARVCDHNCLLNSVKLRNNKQEEENGKTACLNLWIQIWVIDYWRTDHWKGLQLCGCALHLSSGKFELERVFDSVPEWDRGKSKSRRGDGEYLILLRLDQSVRRTLESDLGQKVKFFAPTGALGLALRNVCLSVCLSVHPFVCLILSCLKVILVCTWEFLG